MNNDNYKLKQTTENFHHELGIILLEIVKPEWGLVTITDVAISPDLRQAKVWVSASDAAIKSLNAEAPAIYRAIKPRLRIRHIPRIQFYKEDGSINRVETIFEELDES